jgi:hypothetical protein
MMKKYQQLIDKENRKKASFVASLYIIVTLLLFFTISFTQPDPPIRTIPVPMELSDEMIIEDIQIAPKVGTKGEANQGGGTPSNKAFDHPTPPDKGDRVISNDNADFTHDTGQDGMQSVDNPRAPVKNTNDDTFTFGTGGNGGGSGTGDGNLFGDGSDNTKGNGKGGSGSGSRVIIQSPCPPSVGTEEGDIWLSVWVDEDGKVIKAENRPSKTTTSSTAVIGAAIKGVVNCMRFSKNPGAAIVKIDLGGPIRIRRN